MRLLSIDWDYFIPTYPFDPQLCMLYDWTMKDAPFFRDGIWLTRGAAFLLNGLPLPDTTGLEQSFWSRFRFAKDVKMYYGDSHLYAACIPDAHCVHEVWNFDAHHDLGYRGTQESILNARLIECDNWMGWYKHAGAKVRVLYPRWRPEAKQEEAKPVFPGIRQIDNEQPVSVPFHAVYVCRSSSWSPAWLDDKFQRFMEACPLLQGAINLQPDYDALVPRQFTREALDEQVAMWKQARELHEKMRRGELVSPIE